MEDVKPSIHLLLESDHIELDGLLHATFAAINSGDAVGTIKQLDFFWARLAMHIRAEHLWLFPEVREITGEALSDFCEIPGLLKTLRHDHDFFMRELARAVKAMRLVFDFGNEAETLAVVRELLDGVMARLKTHNRIEEEKLYPIASEKFLDPARMDELFLSVKMELDKYPARFAGGVNGKMTA